MTTPWHTETAEETGPNETARLQEYFFSSQHTSCGLSAARLRMQTFASPPGDPCDNQSSGRDAGGRGAPLPAGGAGARVVVWSWWGGPGHRWGGRGCTKVPAGKGSATSPVAKASDGVLLGY